MGKKVLQCEYCRHIISEYDSKCPNCGANCVNVIKKFKAEQEAEAKKRSDELQAQTEEAAKAIGRGFKAFMIIPIAIFIFVFIFIAVMSMNHFNKPSTHSSNNDKEKVEEQVKKESYTVQVDSYELYEYQHKSFDRCNTKEGYQRIAFHFVIENTGDKTISTSWIVHNISVKADSEVVKESYIHADDSFCNVKSGKKDYVDLNGSSLLVGDKESGYIGYEVPTNAEKIKFIFDDEHVIEMDNPAYKKN